MSNMSPARNRIYRYIGGGDSRGVRLIRDIRRNRKRMGEMRKFGEWVRGHIPKGDSPSNHVHPRHLRNVEGAKSNRQVGGGE